MASVAMSALTARPAVSSKAGSSKAAIAGTPVLIAGPVAGRQAVVVGVKASLQNNVSRREAMAGLSMFAAATLNAQPAFALFDSKSKDEVYTESTTAIIAETEKVLAFKRGEEGRGEAVAALRPKINTWVAKYRRDGSITGKPSYGNTYSALDAVAGHFNNFGLDYPLPKKRSDRIIKELEDAKRLLGRGR